MRSVPLRLGLAASLAAVVALLPSLPAAAVITEPVAAAAPAAAVPATSSGQNVLINAATGDAATAAVARAVVRAGGSVIVAWPGIGVTLAASGSSSRFVADLRSTPGVESAGLTRGASGQKRGTGAGSRGTQTIPEPEPRFTVADPLEAEQWDMSAIRGPSAHEVSGGSRDVVVGVLDSGVDSAHPDLVGQVDPALSAGCTDNGVAKTDRASWSPTTSAHGTHVAGTIAAKQNGVGITGVAPDTTLASVKVVDDDGFIYPEYAVCGFVWAAEHGFEVTNNSYYVDPFEFWCAGDLDQAAAAESVRRAVEFSRTRGVLTVTSAGNSGIDLADDSGRENCSSIPAELDGVVTVSSVARAGDGSLVKSDFSNYGEGVIDVTAPGSDVLSTIPGGDYASYNGTSMASPHVAGVVALLAAAHPGAAPDELESILKRQARPLPCPVHAGAACPDERGTAYFGAGLVDAFSAVAERPGSEPVAVVAGGSIRAGAPFTVDGANFDTGERIRLSLDGGEASGVVGAGAFGGFSLTGSIPAETPVGVATLHLTGSRGRTADVSVQVTPALAAPTITSPAPGAKLPSGAVTVAGKAVPKSSVAVELDAKKLTVTADSAGTYLASFTVSAGSHRVSARQTLADGTVSLAAAPVSFVVVTDSVVDPEKPDVPGGPGGPGGAGGAGGSSTGAALADAKPCVAAAAASDPAAASNAARVLAFTGSQPAPLVLAALIVLALGVLLKMRRRPSLD